MRWQSAPSREKGNSAERLRALPPVAHSRTIRELKRVGQMLSTT